eukprot:augustus_masked-scaffold_16-processed-gene-6.8-mRNA-1 protein AED:1.00 eAED:1.00 QI:0/0/0/0/1/1/3/0/330
MHLISEAPPGLNVNPRPVEEIEEKWLKMGLIQLQDAGIIRRSMDPVFSAPIHFVPKKSDDERKNFRLVLDMRQISDRTIRTALQLPHLEQQLQRSREARYYGALDQMSGFDYLPIHSASRKYFNLITPWGAAYEFQGTVQGWENSPMLFQDRIYREVLEKAGYMEPDAIKRELIQQAERGKSTRKIAYHFWIENITRLDYLVAPLYIMRKDGTSRRKKCAHTQANEQDGFHDQRAPAESESLHGPQEFSFLARSRWDANKIKMKRLERWIFRIQDSNLRFFHAKGEENIMADMISRWGNPDAAIEESKIVLAELDDNAEDVNEEDNPTLK